jgi:hypothetical protein
MSHNISIRTLTYDEAQAQVTALTDILIDCVEGGASVSFMSPLRRETAESFWRGVAEGVASGERALLIAEDALTGRVVGTVQVILGQPENQPKCWCIEVRGGGASEPC